LFNYCLKRLNVWSVFKVITIIGLVFGGFWGLLLGIYEGNLFGILGGLFLGFIFGLVNSLTATICAILFNMFASHLGGIDVFLERKDVFLDSLEQPLPLVTTPTNNNDRFASATSSSADLETPEQ